MGMIETDAWVLYRGSESSSSSQPAELRREKFQFSDLTEQQVLAEPVYGCWEGNMTHALERRPTDICRERGEEKIVIGNAGVVRVLKTGAEVKGVKPGDLCLVFCNGIWDEFGYPKKIYGYDAPGSIGLLAKRTKLHEKNLILIPQDTRSSLQQWAAFSLRYVTAWANWRVAFNCWRTMLSEEECPEPFVWGWGGGVSLAELALAKLHRCKATLISANDERLDLARQMGLDAIDRRSFARLSFDEQQYKSDSTFRKNYKEAEEAFLNIVRQKTQGAGVSIFIDYIGLPVHRATLKALARQGVVTTAGWKHGMKVSTLRAIECINRNIHIHTHYARYAEGLEAVAFAERTGWMPAITGEVYDWDNLPLLAQDYAANRIGSYFPIFRVNQI